MTKEKEIKTTTVSYIDFHDDDYKHVTKYYIKNSLGEYVYFHTRDRLIAQAECDKLYSKGHYKVVECKSGKRGREECSAYGVATRKGQTKPN